MKPKNDPAPLATGPTKWRAERCVTHHHACDCREWEHATLIEELERDAERYRWLLANGKPAAEGLVMRLPADWNDAIDAAMDGANA